MAQGIYTITSNYHSAGNQYPAGSSNQLFLPANQTASLILTITNADITSLTWTNSGSYPVVLYPTSNGFLVSFSMTSGPTSYSTRTTTLNLTAQSTCGQITQSFSFTVVTSGWFSITTFPNPSTTDMNVMIDQEAMAVRTLSKDEKIIIHLLEFKSARKERQWVFTNNQREFKLNVGGIRKGQYILVIRKGKYQESKQVIIGN